MKNGKTISQKLIILFSKDIKLIESDSKNIYNVTKNLFQINAVLLNFLFIKESWKKSVFNIDNNNNKCFFQHQISILEWFLKDHVTLKTGVMMLKIQLWSQE